MIVTAVTYYDQPRIVLPIPARTVLPIPARTVLPGPYRFARTGPVPFCPYRPVPFCPYRQVPFCPYRSRTVLPIPARTVLPIPASTVLPVPARTVLPIPARTVLPSQALTQTPSIGLRHPSSGGRCRKAMLGVWSLPTRTAPVPPPHGVGAVRGPHLSQCAAPTVNIRCHLRPFLNGRTVTSPNIVRSIRRTLLRFCFFFFCCPINCADHRGTAPAPLVPASPPPPPPATPRAHSACRPRPQRSTGSDVRLLAGCHPKETLHCC